MKTIYLLLLAVLGCSHPKIESPVVRLHARSAKGWARIAHRDLLVTMVCAESAAPVEFEYTGTRIAIVLPGSRHGMENCASTEVRVPEGKDITAHAGAPFTATVYGFER